ncbi:MAG: hypothetical protein SLAVMIC_00345 [uncultured marine phage]|uniref:Uncharacterized protein n=1 Tax=uncultured marine phage TaxID=707152 RepID=A0A8D9FS26_9VIRU|nr:MAG: hypothetical protein SLAVMIC_00345 [uncultured marine phage]
MKRILLLMMLMISSLTFSQTYKCEFNRYIEDHSNNPVNATHTLNGSTELTYKQTGHIIELLSVYKDNSVTFAVIITKNGEQLLYVDYYTFGFPKSFSMSYEIKGFEGDCDCELE